MDTQKTRFIVCEFYVVYCGSYVQEYEQTKIEQRKDHNYGQLRSVTVSYGQLLVKAVYSGYQSKIIDANKDLLCTKHSIKGNKVNKEKYIGNIYRQ